MANNYGLLDPNGVTANTPYTPPQSLAGLLGLPAQSQGGGLMPPPQAAPQMAQMAQMAQAAPQQLPMRNPVNPILGLLDNLLLGGAGQKASNAAYEQKAQNVGMRNMQARALQIAQTEGPEAALMFVSQPTLYEKLHEQNNTPAGDTAFRNGVSTVAPLFDPASGRWTTPTETGASVGGDYADTGGVISSKRDGSIAHITTPQTSYASGDTYRGPTVTTLGPNGPPKIGDPSGAVPSGSGVGDPRGFFKNFILPHEGGLNPSDMNGSPTNFGINQAANPGVNVRSLTPDGAAGIFADKYYKPSGAGNLPPALAAIHADTSFINPAKAKQFLAQSGGDPAKYMQLRTAWMDAMVANNPAAAKYGRAWTKRNADLARYAGLNGQSGSAAAAPASGLGAVVPGQTNTPVTPQEAMRLGLAPGTYQRDPMGKVTAMSAAPAEDVARINSLKDTAQGLRALQQEQSQFMDHNKAFGGTGAGYAALGPVPNPFGAVQENLNPDYKAMTASEGKQVLMVKPANAGARILQSELPFWEAQVQSPTTGGKVNQSILDTTSKNLAKVQPMATFYENYIYQHGNLRGADDAWAAAQKGGHASAPSQAIRTLTPAEARSLPPGTHFRTTDGRVMVR